MNQRINKIKTLKKKGIALKFNIRLADEPSKHAPGFREHDG